MNEELVQYLDGQLLGIQCMLGALIAAHPDSAALARRIDELLDLRVAQSLGSSRAVDAQVRGLEQTKLVLRKMLGG